MVSFFHDVGLLIHFEEAFGGLRELVIINPQWLALVMKVPSLPIRVVKF